MHSLEETPQRTRARSDSYPNLYEFGNNNKESGARKVLKISLLLKTERKSINREWDMAWAQNHVGVACFLWPLRAGPMALT